MALGKNCISKAKPCGLRTSKAGGDALDVKTLDFGCCNTTTTTTTTRTLGRKRVVLPNPNPNPNPNYMELSSSIKTPSKKKRIGTRLNSERDDLSSSSTHDDDDDDSPFMTPTKKRTIASRLDLEETSSSLEALPQDILVRLLCCVDHDDLKQLFHVSPIVREATLIAKDWHFAFSTPSSKTAAIRYFGDLEDPNQFDMATPNAPKRCGSCRPRINREKLTDISVALFHSPEEEPWEKKCGLFVETEV